MEGVMSGFADFVRRSPSARFVFAVPIAVRRKWNSHKYTPMLDVLQRVEDLVASDLRVKVAEFEGEFLLGPRSHLLRRVLCNGKYEPELVKVFLRHLKPELDVIDVGANVGMYSVLAGKHLTTGRVLAAEPTTAAFRRLGENVAFNGVADRVVLYRGLVSDREEMSSINFVPGREEYSSAGTICHPAVEGQSIMSEKITSRSIDQLVREHQLKPGLIKIDVEGFEGPVFAGAEETLKTHRPVVISEFSPALLRANNTAPEAILALLDRCGYTVTDPLARGTRPEKREMGDILAVPR